MPQHGLFKDSFANSVVKLKIASTVTRLKTLSLMFLNSSHTRLKTIIEERLQKEFANKLLSYLMLKLQII